MPFLMVLVFAAVLAIVGVYIRRLDDKREFTMPTTYFMPYSVCPECAEEGLHWMRRPNWDAVAMLVAGASERMEANHRTWLRLGHNPIEFQYEGGEELAISVATNKSDVIRTCRECGHEWGQNVGPLLKLVA